MAYTPSPYKKVSSITITSAGEGYVTAPEVTLTGGGGTGAEAYSVIDSLGRVTEIVVTAPGYGYTSAPDVIIDPSPTEENASALALVTSVNTDYNTFKESIAHLLTNQIPEFVRNEYPIFVTFLQKYYEFLDQEGQVHNKLLNSDEFFDINRTPDVFVPMFVQQYAQYFPQNSRLNQRTLVKFIKDFYEAKGSEKATELLFRVLFNAPIEFYYPSLDILRASDGIWIKNITFKLTVDSQVTVDPFDLIGKAIRIYYYENQGLVVAMKTVPTEVLSVVKNAYTFPPVYEVTTTLQDSSQIKIPGAGAAGYATVSGGEVTDIVVTNGGSGYYAAPVVVFTSDTGSGAEGRAVLDGNGQITDVIITEPGSGYLTPPAVTFDTNQIRTHIHLEGDKTHVSGVVPGEVVHTTYGYVVRILSDVTIGSILSGSPNYGFDVGQIYGIDESGSEGSYAVDDPNPANNYFLNKNKESDTLIVPYVAVGRDNRARIKITSVNNDGLPTSIQLLDSGYDFERESFTYAITSPTGSELELEFTTGGFSVDTGKFKDSRGMLSNICKLQDNYYYQDYSYVIKSTVPSNKWLDIVKKTTHPTGTQVFGELIIGQQVDFSPYISVPVSAIQFYEFFEETVTISDGGFSATVFTIAKVLNDSISSPTDDKSVSFSKILVDSSTSSEDNTISFGKNVFDSSSASESIDSVTFYKVLTDSVTITEIFVKGQNPADVEETTDATDAASSAFSKVITDSISSPTDDSTVSFGKVPSDSIDSPTDDIDNFVIGKVLSDSMTPVELIDSVSVNKVLVDSATTEDSPSLSYGKPASDVIDEPTESSSTAFNKVIVSPVSAESVIAIESDNVNYVKNLKEFTTASEDNAINISKKLSDSISTPTEAGFINKQSYFLEDYVSAGYVGTNYSI